MNDDPHQALAAITDSIVAALQICTTTEVLGALTGNFVGLYEEVLTRQGEDPSKTIVIDNGTDDQRVITIHALGEGRG